MKAQKLTIHNLFGYFNKTIYFNDDINLLVGINGSGKTSVLNIVNWLLTPSLANLSITEFEKLELLFQHKNKDYSVVVVQDPKALTYNLKNITDDQVYFPLTLRLKIPTSQLTKNQGQKELLYDEYLRLGPDKDEAEIWSFLFNELPKPIVIGLDRYLFIEEKNEMLIYGDDRLHGLVNKIPSSKTSPLDEVRKLANREYNIYKTKLVDLNSILNNKIMLSAFDEITSSTLDELENISIISIEQVETLHKSVESFFKETIKENRNSQKKTTALKKIEGYFTNLKKVIKEAERVKSDKRFTLLYLSNISQFKKLREFIKEFEDFEKKSKDYYHNLNVFLETINKFYTDSSKELAFFKATSELTFNVLDKQGKVISRNRDLKTLSSGEKQILILLTYLKFYDKNETIFIIDEPELSLHPKWQEDFLHAVKVLTPKNTQIMIATHSPIIVAGNEDFCKVLLPYN